MPDPVQWAFVRRDDESERRLAEAVEVFNQMARDLDRPIADRQMLEIWSLACTANIASRQVAAAEYCAELISKHPCNIYAVPWAMARDYPVDFARALAIASQNVEADPADVRPVLITTICKLRAEDYAGAKETLHKHRARFESQEQIGVWK
jgi:hypothetical protein